MDGLPIAAFSVELEQDRTRELVGYRGPARIPTGVPHPRRGRLEANGIVLGRGADRIALIAVDALFAGSELQPTIARDAGIASDRVVLVASHTHFAPGLDATKPELGTVDPTYVDHVARLIGAAIADAPIETDVQLGRGRTTHLRHAVRRRHAVHRAGRRYRYGVVNAPARTHPPHSHVDVVTLHCADRPVAVIWSWPCHAVNGPMPLQTSADFPGAVRQALRERADSADLPVLYLPGFAGDLRADHRAAPSLRNLVNFPLTPRFAAMDVHAFDEFCAALAEQVEAAHQQALRVEPSRETRPLALETASVPLDALIESDDPATNDRRLTAARLDLAGQQILFVNAEVCSDYHRLLDPIVEHAVVTGYADDVFGYLPTDRQIAEGGYEAAGFFRGFSLQGAFRPTIEHHVTRLVQELFA